MILFSLEKDVTADIPLFIELFTSPGFGSFDKNNFPFKFRQPHVIMACSRDDVPKIKIGKKNMKG